MTGIDWLLDAVLARWISEGAVPRPAVAPLEVQAFERSCGHAVPEALRALLLRANGTHERPPVEYAFLALQDYHSPLDSGAPLAARVSRASYVFAHYMDYSWAYAMDFVTGAVRIIGDQHGLSPCIAESAEEFFELYVRDDARLAPP